MNWYYSPDGSEKLEVSEEALAQLARDGRLTGGMLLWRDGLPDWRPAQEIRPDLFGLAGSPMAGGGEEQPGAPGTVAVPATAAYYPPPPPPAGTRPINSSALTSVISGGIGVFGSVSGFCCCFGSLIAPIAGLVAVIFGHMAYSAAKGHPEAESDKNLALVGLILGYLTLLVLLGYFAFMLLTVGLGAVAEMSKELHLP